MAEVVDQKPKLLLADDSASIRKVVELTFADEGIDVTSVADADAAMEAFVRIQPDIVLVDIGLPGMPGYRFCELIKGDPATRHIPVLLLVGSFEPFDHEAAERACADGFLTKPFVSIRDLVARVIDLLGKGQDDNEIPTISADPIWATPSDAPREGTSDDLDEATGSSPEDDIESLYTESFAPPRPAVNDVPAGNTLLGGHGLDDEMIETIRPTGVDASAGTDFEDTIREPRSTYDWNVQSYGDTASTAEAAEVNVKSGAEVEAAVPTPSSFGSAASEDDLLDLGSSGGTVSEPWYNSFASAAPPRNTAETGATSDDVAAGHNVEWNRPPEQSVEDYAMSDSVRTGSSPAASPELIEQVTTRVIEHLSDRVIREIAQEAVPRIAEKLIREALADDHKSR